jgi:hypothetical protein
MSTRLIVSKVNVEVAALVSGTGSEAVAVRHLADKQAGVKRDAAQQRRKPLSTPHTQQNMPSQ